MVFKHRHQTQQCHPNNRHSSKSVQGGIQVFSVVSITYTEKLWYNVCKIKKDKGANTVSY